MKVTRTHHVPPPVEKITIELTPEEHDKLRSMVYKAYYPEGTVMSRFTRDDAYIFWEELRSPKSE